jgi:Ca-activated chloride channel family protein
VVSVEAYGWAWPVAVAVLVAAVAAEGLHFRRVVRAAPLAFGPRRGVWALAVVSPLLRAASLAAVAWGLAALRFDVPPKTHKTGEIKDTEYRHLVLVLDVSKSMTLTDSGPTAKQTRAHRAADVIQSFFDRVQAERYKTTVVAVANGAKPVVIDTTDREVVRNILTDLPMRHAFKPGETDIFSGLEEAARIAKPWVPGTAILMVVTDGDTVPATGMPKMPPSIGSNVLVIGVGNPTVGQPIAGHSSRQDASTLRQVAVRLGGVYHDANEKHLSSELVSSVDGKAAPKDKDKWTKREYALLCVGVGTAVLAFLPALLTLIGTGWTPGRRVGKEAALLERGRPGRS